MTPTSTTGALLLSLMAMAYGRAISPTPVGRIDANAKSFAGSSVDSARLGPAARRALALPGFHWLHRATRRADLYVLEQTAGESQLPKLSDAVEQAISTNLRWLDAADAGPRLQLFFVGSREEMRPLTGAAPGGWSVTEEGTAFFVMNDTVRPALRHEMMHLLSWRIWGIPGGVWLSEGVGTVASGGCRGYAFDDIAAALDRAGELASFDELRHRFTFAGERGAQHYLQAASVVAYIDRVYGRKRLREFWASGGLGGVGRSLGVDVKTLETRWRDDIAHRPAPRSWARMWSDIRTLGCE